jgi:hypothetical protein
MGRPGERRFRHPFEEFPRRLRFLLKFGEEELTQLHRRPSV